MSSDDFTVYLAANNASFNITITASQSVLGKTLSFIAAVIVIAVAFVF